ncbi:MAG: L-histidine N(alpha)-methyltransferase [Pseudomonadota bacterium]
MTAACPQSLPSNVSVRDLEPDQGSASERLLEGLSGEQKQINPKWFYDEHGSELFEQITRLPEYYPTRTERRIFCEHAEAIAAACGEGRTLLEPGSGSCEKIRLLLDALRPGSYMPIDISADFLFSAAIELANEYPWLQVDAVCADFAAGWDFLSHYPASSRVVFYPGSTLGNFEPAGAIGFLTDLMPLLGESGGVLIGVDRHKDKQMLEAAYNDAQGVTAQFNLNVLRRVNALCDAQFDLAAFEHRAVYDTVKRRIEMHLVSTRSQRVRVAGKELSFASGESIHTENSYKYSEQDFHELARKAGFRVAATWTDRDELFAVYYLEPQREP